MPSKSKTITADQLIDERLEEARSALWWSELIRTFLAVCIGSMIAILAWLVMDHWIYSPGPLVRTICLMGLIAVATWLLFRKAYPVLTSRVSNEYAAWALEQDSDDFRGQLTSYVTLKREAKPAPDQKKPSVRSRVIQAIGSRAASLLKKHDALPSEATGTFAWWIAAAGVFAVLAGYIVASPKSSLASAQRLVAPLADIDPVKRVQISDVQPGNTQALAGRSVDVSAKIKGLRSSENAWIVWESGGSLKRVEMDWEATDDRFFGSIDLEPTAGGMVPYWIEAGDAKTESFELEVENVPVVAVDRVFYQPPAYTQRPERTTSSPAITAIDGTKIQLTAKTNRPVVRAEVQFNPKRIGERVDATAGVNRMTISDDGTTLVSEITLRSARSRSASVELQSYRIRVWDSNERSNPSPIIYPIEVIPDLPPEITIVVPKNSPVKVPVDAQQIIEIHAMDADFELSRVKLKIQRGLDTLAEPDVWRKFEDISGKGNQVIEYRFRPMEHQLLLGDNARITATAFDNRSLPDDPSVKPNETSTDPLEIRIIASDPDVPEDPTGNDGLSKPDEKPASEAGQSETGEGGQGGSGSGQSDNQKTDGPPQEGSNGGGTSEGDGKEDPSQDQDSASEKPSGDGTTNDSDPNDSTGDTPQDSTGDPSQGANPSEQNTPGQQNEDSGDAQDDMSDAGNDPAESTENNAGSDRNSGSSQDNQSNKTNSGPKQPKSDDASGKGDNAREEGSEDNNAQQDASGQPNSAPKHDAEAFERIKDYLEKNRKQGQNQQQGNQANPDEKNSPDRNKGNSKDNSSDPESGKGSPDSKDSNSEKNSANEDSQSPEKGTGSSEDSSSDPKDSDTGSSQNKEGEGNDPKGASGDQDNTDPKRGTDSDDDPTGEGNQDSNPDYSESADSSSMQDDQGASKSGTPNNGNPNQQQPSTDDSSKKDQANESPSDTKDTADPNDTGSPNQSTSSEQGRNANSNPSDGGEGGGPGTMDDGEEFNQPPPPPDLEYTKKATDMVLDYLDETRDRVDDDLLKDLDWTKEDLRRFRERWEQVRDLEQNQPTGEKKNEIEDALRSLGMRPDGEARRSTGSGSDKLRDVNDSGNRRKAPAAFRDLFDVFRRSNTK